MMDSHLLTKSVHSRAAVGHRGMLLAETECRRLLNRRLKDGRADGLPGAGVPGFCLGGLQVGRTR